MLASDSDTVKATESPSAALASDTLTAGRLSSSSLIVPVAVASPSVAFAGLDSVSVKVSSSSSAESSVVATLTVFVVSPAVNVSVPDCAVKSVPPVAVPSDVAYSTVTCRLLAADSDTVKATASPSAALASDTLTAGMITGPATTLDSECDSLRSSSVQIAPDELQFKVAGSVIVRAPVPAGRTLSFQPTLLPRVLRFARLMLPPLTLTAFWMSLYPTSGPSLKVRSTKKSPPSWLSGTFEKLAVSGSPSGGAATVTEGLLVSWTGLSSFEQMAPCVPQVRLPGSVIITVSSPSGSTVISQRSLRPSTRDAPVTSPLVTVNA